MFTINPLALLLSITTLYSVTLLYSIIRKLINSKYKRYQPGEGNLGLSLLICDTLIFILWVVYLFIKLAEYYNSKL